MGHKYLTPPLLGRGHAHFSEFFFLAEISILCHFRPFGALLVTFVQFWPQFWSLLATYGLAAASEVDELMSRRSQVKKVTLFVHPVISFFFFLFSFILSFSLFLFLSFQLQFF